MVHSCLPRPCLGSRRELFQWPNPNPNPDPNPNQVWHAEVNFFHGDRRCGVVVYLQPPELDTAEADAEAPGAPATASGGEAARSPAPSARLSKEPGSCAGPRIERVDEAAAATLPLEVFTTPGCAYCARAKRFFKRHSLPYTERDVSADEAVLREMIQRASVATCLARHQPRPLCNPI